MTARLGCPRQIGSTGWNGFSAWIWLFSSTAKTTARSGGSRYKPTTSVTFSTNCGSVESLKFSLRQGWSPNSAPDPADARRRDPNLLGQRASRPVRRVFRHRLQRLHQHLFDLLVADRAWHTQPRIVTQPVEPRCDKTAPPLPDRRPRHPETLGDLQMRLRPQRTPTRSGNATPTAARSSDAVPTAPTAPADPRSARVRDFAGPQFRVSRVSHRR